MILGFTEGVTACEPYDEETGEGCLGEGCNQCIWVRFICINCEQYKKCDYKYKPKILPSNRQALRLYSLSQKFSCLPYDGGLSNQPHRLLLQFQIIMDEIAKQEEIERKRLEKKK